MLLNDLNLRHHSITILMFIYNSMFILKVVLALAFTQNLFSSI